MHLYIGSVCCFQLLVENGLISFSVTLLMSTGQDLFFLGGEVSFANCLYLVLFFDITNILYIL